MLSEGDIIRCDACDGYGWIEADFDADADEAADAGDGSDAECRWCGGIGYVYRGADGISRRISPEDCTLHAETLERLELERLREIGYTGQAKKPWQQQIRIERGDRIAKPPGDAP